MKYDVEKIIRLLIKDNYISPLHGQLLKTQADNLNIREISIMALRENLSISLSSSRLSPRNIRDFNALLNAIKNVKEDMILSVGFTENNKSRNIYIDTLLETTFDEL